MEEKKKKNEKLTILVMLILAALIIIIFLFIRCLGLIEHDKNLRPTGNVDIFDIIFGKDCESDKCDCDEPTTDNPLTNDKKDKNNTTDNSGKKDPDLDVTVYDKDVVYSTNTKLNIFTQTSYYVVENKIAPTSENSYQFIIRNNNNLKIKYSLEMSETNKYNINMKYRLKLNGTYVVGSDTEYVSANKLAQYDMILDGKTYDVYTLDWKWVESDNDTKVGTDINSNYKLNLKINASKY